MNTSQTTIQNLSSKKLEKIGKKVFGESFQYALNNDYSRICGFLFVKGETIQMQDIKFLEYYGFQTTLICKKNTGFVIHVHTKMEESN